MEYYRLRVLVKHTDEFGKGREVARHCMPMHLDDIGNAIEDCATKGFDTLVLYTSLPALDLFKPYFEQYWDVENKDGALTLYV